LSNERLTSNLPNSQPTVSKHTVFLCPPLCKRQQSQRSALPSLPSQVIAAVDRNQLRASPHYDGTDSRRNAPFVELALCAAAEALADADWQPSTPSQRAATGVCIGAGIGCTADTADAGALISAGRIRRVSPFFVPRILVNMAAGAISIRYGFQGPNHAPSTACATGVHAIGDAFRMIQRGDATVMVCLQGGCGFPCGGWLVAVVDELSLLECFPRLLYHHPSHPSTTNTPTPPINITRDQNTGGGRCRGKHRRHRPGGLQPFEGAVDRIQRQPSGSFPAL